MLKYEEIDKALQAMWDAASAPEWIHVLEPIIVDGKTIEPGVYALDAKGNYVRQPDDVEAQL